MSSDCASTRQSSVEAEADGPSTQQENQLVSTPSADTQEGDNDHVEPARKEEDEDGENDDQDDDEEEEEEDADSIFLKRLRALVQGFYARGDFESVVGIMQQVFRFYATRKYITPDIDLQHWAKTFVDSDSPIAYCWSLDFDVAFFARLCYEGFLSISSYPEKIVMVLMPWIDPQRAVMEFGSMRVSKSLTKRARGYHMTVNADFEGVVRGCVAQHGEGWLWPRMQQLLRDCFCAPEDLHQQIQHARGGGDTQQWKARLQACGFRVATFELWDSSTGDLVAADLGYVVGACYVSMSGFRKPNTKSCGTVQLTATYALLKRCGFAFWDLGMVMEYKTGLGARVVPRREFIDMFHLVRDRRCNLCIPSGAPGVNVSSAGTAASTASGSVPADVLVKEARAMRTRASVQKKQNATPEQDRPDPASSGKGKDASDVS